MIFRGAGIDRFAHETLRERSTKLPRKRSETRKTPIAMQAVFVEPPVNMVRK